MRITEKIPISSSEKEQMTEDGGCDGDNSPKDEND